MYPIIIIGQIYWLFNVLKMLFFTYKCDRIEYSQTKLKGV